MTNLGRIDIFIILSLPVHKHNMSPHLFWSLWFLLSTFYYFQHTNSGFALTSIYFNISSFLGINVTCLWLVNRNVTLFLEIVMWAANRDCFISSLPICMPFFFYFSYLIKPAITFSDVTSMWSCVFGSCNKKRQAPRVN